MSRRRVQHLVRRNGAYQIRLPIPLKLQDVFERKELRWSARTFDSSVASRRALEATLAFRRFCDKLITMKDLSSEDAKGLAQKIFEELVAGFRLKRTEDADQAAYENGLQGVLVEDAVKEFNDQLETRCFSNETKKIAAKRLGLASADLAGIDTQVLDRHCQKKTALAAPPGSVAFSDEQSVSVFQNLTRDHPPGGDDVHSLSAVAAERRGPAP